eukprot:TRINITY_DN10204_c0_g1_i1.p1 TRINITY_DN10204_c0_g1~~TRINITY_DN10204_c0_g1_i1.p1  ORF type:complete len:526 (-),score=85.85 TRINITY_DN10204_c0_g1_i1:164-1615(-)
MAFVIACVDWLRTHDAHNQEGLFRKAGAEDRVSALQKQVAYASDFKFDDDEDPHNIATLLKRYFRAMRTPLLTYELYDLWIACDEANTDQERFDDVFKTLGLLEDRSKQMLKIVMEYLHQVSLSSDVNKMTATNLAIVFSPNLLKPIKDDPLTLISDASHATNTVACLITSYKDFFEDKRLEEPVAEAEKKDLVANLRERYSLHRVNTSLEIGKICETLSADIAEKRQKHVAKTIRNGSLASISLDLLHAHSESAESHEGPSATSEHTRLESASLLEALMVQDISSSDSDSSEDADIIETEDKESIDENDNEEEDAYDREGSDREEKQSSGEEGPIINEEDTGGDEKHSDGDSEEGKSQITTDAPEGQSDTDNDGDTRVKRAASYAPPRPLPRSIPPKIDAQEPQETSLTRRSSVNAPSRPPQPSPRCPHYLPNTISTHTDKTRTNSEPKPKQNRSVKALPTSITRKHQLLSQTNPDETTNTK